MASVRASLLTQARAAAQRIAARGGGVTRTDPAVERLARCATLSPDAARTLDWAVHTLDAHRTDAADGIACALLRAARSRLDTTTDTGVGRRERSDTLAWH